MSVNRKKSLLSERSKLTRKLLLFREMLPGSFIERKITCGKKTCVCHTEGKKHSAFQLSYRMNNKTVSKMIPKPLANDVRKKVALQKQFKQIVKRIQEINIELLKMELNERKPSD